MGNTYFDVLRLPRNANDVQIGDAYRRLRAAYANNPAQLRAVEDAYRILANPITRRDYVLALEAGRAPTGAPTPAESADDTPAPRQAQPASRPSSAPTLFRRAGAATRRNKTELLDTADAGQREAPRAPAPPPPGQARRSRRPTELIDSDSEHEHDKPARSVDRPVRPDVNDPEPPDRRAQPDAPGQSAQHAREPAPDSSSETGRDAGRDVTRISPTRRPKTIATVEVAYQGQVEVFELPNGTNWIGRPSKDDPLPAVPLPDPDRFVSRKHARIFLDDSTWTVTDNSENGTLLNGKPLRKGQPNRLKDGDVLTIEGRILTIRRVQDR